MTVLPEDFTELGNTGIKIPRLGTGAWSWGDRIFWGFGRGYQEGDVEGAFLKSIESGITFFDTAEIYGSGKSEQLLGQFARSLREGGGPEITIATKFLPYPWLIWSGALVGALRRSLVRLGVKNVDLYQIHQPLPPMPVEVWAAQLAKAVQLGLTRSVGVSNYNANQMRSVHAVLSKQGVPLASNQMEYSLLNRSIEKNGVLDACRELGITLIAYSPIAKGILSGKYTPTNPPPGLRGRYYSSKFLARIQPLLILIREIGQAHGGKTPAQVSLNWTICKGTVPIPGGKNALQVEENIGALGWRLTPEEVHNLDETSSQLA